MISLLKEAPVDAGASFVFLCNRKFRRNSLLHKKALRAKDAQLAVRKLMLRIPLARGRVRKRTLFYQPAIQDDSIDPARFLRLHHWAYEDHRVAKVQQNQLWGRPAWQNV